MVCATRWECGSLRVQGRSSTTPPEPVPALHWRRHHEVRWSESRGLGPRWSAGRVAAEGASVGSGPGTDASRTPLHGSAGVGAANRSTPTGASANGCRRTIATRSSRPCSSPRGSGYVSAAADRSRSFVLWMTAPRPQGELGCLVITRERLFHLQPARRGKLSVSRWLLRQPSAPPQPTPVTARPTPRLRPPQRWVPRP